MTALAQADIDWPATLKFSSKYAEHIGEYCPICNFKGIDRLSDEEVEKGAILIVQSYCYGCRTRWEEIFRFERLANIELSDEVIEFEALDSSDASSASKTSTRLEPITGKGEC